uniref:hypothetical protein n=1 Tax=Marinobacterium profundum TaxID=1714300 RepID=UPI000A64D104|nr:hypothetical protein [Marinobacterium profundum]
MFTTYDASPPLLALAVKKDANTRSPAQWWHPTGPTLRARLALVRSLIQAHTGMTDSLSDLTLLYCGKAKQFASLFNLRCGKSA